MIKLFTTAAILLLILQGKAQITRFEKSNGTETATYFECIDLFKSIDKRSPLVFVKQMGLTDAGYPLHLVMLSNDKKFDPVQWHKQRKVVILINNGIHPGEPDGIDASMLMTRNIADGKVKLPDNVAIAFIPIYNIGGALNRGSYTRANQNGPKEYGFRGNAQNLDLNRDFTKCDSRNARSFASIFHYLQPDVFVDTHVSDGADYQHTMTLISTQYDKLGGELGRWLKNTFDPALYGGMKKRGWDMVPYVDFEGADFDKGITMFYEPPRYSSGYAALFQCLSFVAETHMLKPYPQRVSSTYDLFLTYIDASARFSNDIIKQRNKAIEEVKQQQSFALKWVNDKKNYDEILFKGYEADSTLSNATGLKKMFFNHSKPFEKKVKYFNVFTPVNFVNKPKAYIIPAGWHEVIDLLRLNKVNIKTLQADTTIFASYYKIDSYESYPKAYEKHHKNYNVKTSVLKDSIHFLKGDYIIFLNQPANRFLIEMLEPTGDDSYFSWNFFDAILQQKEWYSDYRWEDIAADYLSKNPALQKMLEEKKASDPKFAANAGAMLAFIYFNSPWYEKAHLRYPVYRVDE